MNNLDSTKVEISENPIVVNGKRVGTIAVLRGGLGHPNPRAFMDEKVSEYTERCLHNAFICPDPPMPWIRIVINCINDLDYVDFTNQRLKNNEENQGYDL